MLVRESSRIRDTYDKKHEKNIFLTHIQTQNDCFFGTYWSHIDAVSLIIITKLNKSNFFAQNLCVCVRLYTRFIVKRAKYEDKQQKQSKIWMKNTHFCIVSCVSFFACFSLLLSSSVSPTTTAACFSSLLLVLLFDLLVVFGVTEVVTSSRLLRRPWEGSCDFGDFGDLGDLGDFERWWRLLWCLLIFKGIAANVEGEIGAFVVTGVVESANNGLP